MTAPLLPCPFCGSYPEPQEHTLLRCDNSDCPLFDARFTPEQWQARAPSLPAAGGVRDAQVEIVWSELLRLTGPTRANVRIALEAALLVGGEGK